MKKSEIKFGKQYSNGKGTIRRIVGVGPYLLYDGQKNTDCVRYRILAKASGPSSIIAEHNCTRQSFATWAKEEV